MTRRRMIARRTLSPRWNYSRGLHFLASPGVGAFAVVRCWERTTKTVPKTITAQPITVFQVKASPSTR
jgi:hypothetical protein